MDLSILTGVMPGRHEGLLCLIKSLAAYTDGVDWELLVADISGEPVLEASSADPRVKFRPEVPRLGPAEGYNKLAAEAGGEYVCWLNDDVEVLPRWAEAMLKVLRTRHGVGLGCFYYWTPQASQGFHVQTDAGLLYANFGCMRLDLFKELGGFDKECRKYGMDNSITMKVMKHGLGVVSVPGARLLHHKADDEYAEPGDEQQQKDAVAYLRRTYGRFHPGFRRRQQQFWCGPLVLDLTIEQARQA